MPFSIYTQVAYLAWVAMFLVWVFGRIGNKKTLKKPNFTRYLLTTISLYASYVFLFLPYFSKVWSLQLTPQNLLLGLIGVVVCLLGVGFAIWSRFTLGRNWSGVVATHKENHALVQSGPYKIVRHPIYLGFIFAMVGFALTVGYAVSYLAVLMGTSVLLIRVSIEERLMQDIFRESYASYSIRVKKLIPLVW